MKQPITQDSIVWQLPMASAEINNIHTVTGKMVSVSQVMKNQKKQVIFFGVSLDWLFRRK